MQLQLTLPFIFSSSPDPMLNAIDVQGMYVINWRLKGQLHNIERFQDSPRFFEFTKQPQNQE
jgi:hypothetical protein